VLGIKFRPAIFEAFLGAPLVTLQNRVVPIASVFGDAGDALTARVLGAENVARRVDLAEAFLAQRVAPLSQEAMRVRDLVERMETDRALVRVEHAAKALGVNRRTLERLFRHYVGVTPKWVLQRYRMLEAAEQLKVSPRPSLARLAGLLGYADQPHFARDFKRVIGCTPRHFVARQSTQG
jgi:AraC-like DNA-binding protein